MRYKLSAGHDQRRHSTGIGNIKPNFCQVSEPLSYPDHQLTMNLYPAILRCTVRITPDTVIRFTTSNINPRALHTHPICPILSALYVKIGCRNVLHSMCVYWVRQCNLCTDIRRVSLDNLEGIDWPGQHPRVLDTLGSTTRTTPPPPERLQRGTSIVISRRVFYRGELPQPQGTLRAIQTLPYHYIQQHLTTVLRYDTSKWVKPNASPHRHC